MRVGVFANGKAKSQSGFCFLWNLKYDIESQTQIQTQTQTQTQK
jgi:hypothetical protein